MSQSVYPAGCPCGMVASLKIAIEQIPQSWGISGKHCRVIGELNGNPAGWASHYNRAGKALWVSILPLSGKILP
ncbi:MAG: hypothetical protein KDE26_25670 [Bacteroidetes bacterium]|nr:hypothetical protein [Bacteroidota bacterium]